MKKFIALYMMPAAVLAKMGPPTPEEMRSETEKWMAWVKKYGDAVVDPGAPLGKTKRITAAGASDAKNEITAYSLVQGDSLDSVSKMFIGHPHFGMAEGGTIELVECLQIPGM